MSEYVHRSHNVSVLLYHFVCPSKYRKVIFDTEVEMILRETCKEIEKRYELRFIEIGTDKDHVHFLVQGIPVQSPSKIIQIIKSITGREIFRRAPQVKKKLWGGEFWSDGYYVATVGKHGSENTVQEYVKRQGKQQEYQQILFQQESLFG